VLLHQHSKDNKIGAAGATAIANALKENKSITDLDLEGKCFFFSSCFSTNIQKAFSVKQICIQLQIRGEKKEGEEMIGDDRR
jgi:hypothetical protein